MRATTGDEAWGFVWLGKGLAALLFAFWGVFFVEHLGEWFIAPEAGWPPPATWFAQALHLAMLLGLATMIFREGPGAIATVATTAAFFLAIGYRGSLALPLINLAPIACFAIARALGWREGAGQA
ncbi:hypothetical protein [Paludisphaera sp.]|uniref:hypothetical protein n=1 Tax=Paludisphaera sp. TaxID=2017432 RepID=UPI00301C3EAD